uniref:Uncharacterized protein n=1 Tax=viral metagenome TaxID=1070528 RepID=A0A6C0L8Z3_9ZZZZ
MYVRGCEDMNIIYNILKKKKIITRLYKFTLI